MKDDSSDGTVNLPNNFEMVVGGNISQLTVGDTRFFQKPQRIWKSFMCPFRKCEGSKSISRNPFKYEITNPDDRRDIKLGPIETN
jgi:hypothetical protein